MSYASQIKFDLLDVPEGPVVSAEAAEAMASGVRKLLESDVGLSVTGVAGPDEQDGQAPGTVFVGLDVAAVRRASHCACRATVRGFAPTPRSVRSMRSVARFNAQRDPPSLRSLKERSERVETCH